MLVSMRSYCGKCNVGRTLSRSRRLTFTVVEDPLNEAANVLCERSVREHLDICHGAFYDRISFFPTLTALAVEI